MTARGTVSGQIDGAEFGAGLWSDVIRLDGADALATYLDDWLAGAPAVTEHRFGQGSAIYVGTRLDEAGTAWVVDRAIRTAGVEGAPDAPVGVEIVRRVGETRTWTFVLNHSEFGGRGDPGRWFGGGRREGRCRRQQVT